MERMAASPDARRRSSVGATLSYEGAGAAAVEQNIGLLMLQKKLATKLQAAVRGRKARQEAAQRLEGTGVINPKGFQELEGKGVINPKGLHEP